MYECVCVEGGRCDVSIVKVTVEIMTSVYEAIDLLKFVPLSLLFILCLTASIFCVTQFAFKANFTCIFPGYY